MSAPLLEVRDLKTHFVTDLGTVRAVDGASFTLEQGQTLGIVGESGCGKSIMSRSILGIVMAACSCSTADRAADVFCGRAAMTLA